ncbi:Muscle M-line assembly protein unc-89 Uncoordinated protein 89 [Salmonella enterica subsp. enterica]|uniref:Muscle M-line assembly protein unc-89 Uncoordinated protein 89 n=1 Tax=Salmonella enterica I TaxID=59201 RepID=A0A379W4G8_SALET|nr:Muscle M-line assembly protein unc-89 Uncoordinated protein 89 [Salmonella enterica subsp. enterica]
MTSRAGSQEISQWSDTNDNRPTLNGTAEAGSVISIYDGNTLLGVTSANAGGAWSFTPTTGLNDGTRTLTVTATDPAGNVSRPPAVLLSWSIPLRQRFAYNQHR